MGRNNKEMPVFEDVRGEKRGKMRSKKENKKGNKKLGDTYKPGKFLANFDR